MNKLPSLGIESICDSPSLQSNGGQKSKDNKK